MEELLEKFIGLCDRRIEQSDVLNGSTSPYKYIIQEHKKGEEMRIRKERSRSS